MVIGADVCSTRRSAGMGAWLSGNVDDDGGGPPLNGSLELAMAAALAPGADEAPGVPPMTGRPAVPTAVPIATTPVLGGAWLVTTPDRIKRSRRSCGWSRNSGAT